MLTPKPFYSKPLREYFPVGVYVYGSAVGLELEFEGNTFPRGCGTGCGDPECDICEESDPLPDPWCYKEDHSLRGEDNAEYVLTSPILFSSVPEAVKTLFSALNDYGTVLDESNRTSVHVHMNVQDWHLNRFTSFAAMYFIVEEFLTAYCGEHRVGNLFCVTAKDAPYILEKMRLLVKNKCITDIPDNLHYAAFNLHALWKYGSIEIRSMRGAMNPEQVIDWVAILQHIYDQSENYPDPRKVIEMYSAGGAMSVYKKILGKHGVTIRTALGLSDDDINNELRAGIRRVQPFVYATDWSLFKTSEPEDPFLRKKPSDFLGTIEGISLNLENASNLIWNNVP